MPMDLYCLDASPPNRAVYLCLEALGLKPNKKVVNLFNKEHLAPDFVKLNPQHTIPTIDDDGFVLWDSHVINAYLVEKYGKDDSLYPKDLKKRALVDLRLHFDTGVLFPRLRDITFPLLFLKCKEIPEEKRTKVLEAYDMMEKFLDGHDFIAGDSLTIADFCCVATVSTLVEGLRVSAEGHPRVSAWLARCKEVMTGYNNAQDAGMAVFKGAVDAELS